MRTILILFLICFLSSCAKNEAEKTTEAIDVALSNLSNGDCEGAIDVLEEVGPQPSNAVYLQVLASAHACRANFDEIKFISSDLSAIVTTSTASILKSVSIMSLSDETRADSEDYVSIRTGLNILLQPELGVPKQASRITKFGERHASGVGFQALVLSMVNLGKFLNYYGNVNSTGVKGSGAGANKCFLDYNDPRAQAVTGVGTGACVTDNNGHPDLDQTTEDGKRRICEGLMLLTNTLDILENLDLSGSSELAKLETISTQVGTIKTVAVAAGLGTLINMTSQSVCETYLDTPAQLLDMEFLYALMFEKGLL